MLAPLSEIPQQLHQPPRLTPKVLPPGLCPKSQTLTQALQAENSALMFSLRLLPMVLLLLPTCVEKTLKGRWDLRRGTAALIESRGRIPPMR